MANEILLMADVLSREKSVDKDVIFEAIEAALATATRKRSREDIDARVSIHREPGQYDTFRRWEVIDEDEELEFPSRQIRLGQARLDNPVPDLRPGMQGIAKISVNQRRFIWIWTHRFTEWVRIQVWGWWN